MIFFLQQTAKPDTPPQGSSLTAFPCYNVVTQDKFYLISESSLHIVLLFNKINGEWFQEHPTVTQILINPTVPKTTDKAI